MIIYLFEDHFKLNLFIDETWSTIIYEVNHCSISIKQSLGKDLTAAWKSWNDFVPL